MLYNWDRDETVFGLWSVKGSIRDNDLILFWDFFCLAIVPGCSLQPLCSWCTKGQQTSHVRQRPWLYLGQQKAKQLTKNSFLCLVFSSKNFVLSWHTDCRKTERMYRHCQWGKQILTEDKVGDRDNNSVMWWIIILQMIHVCCQLKRSELDWSRAISLLVNSGG